jgi:hypothetical protein
LARRTGSSDLPNALTIEEARETLRVFAELWPATEKYPLLRDDLAQQIARVADLASGQWTGQDLELLTLHEHMGDPRFRGVYFLLALLLEPEHARQLRDQLVVRAAKTRDHTVSDEFVTLLEVRREAAQAQLTPPQALGTTGT